MVSENALSLLPADLLAKCKAPVFAYVALNTTAVQLIAGDVNRLLLWFMSPQSAPVFVSPDPLTAPTTKPGLAVPATAPFFPILSFWDVGPLVQPAWFGYSTGPTTLGVGSISLNTAGPLINGADAGLVQWYRSVQPASPLADPGALARFWRRLTGRRA